MKKRLLTFQEEEVIKLCHPDFGDLTTRRVAQLLNLSQRRIQQTLQNAKKKAPQLFPKLGAYHRPRTIRYESWLDDKVVETF